MRSDIHVLEVDLYRRHINLDVSSCLKVKNFTFRKFYFKFFNERRYVVIRNYFTFPLFDTEDLFRNADFHVLLYLHLASQTNMTLLLCTAQVTYFRRQYISTTIIYNTLAHRASTPSTTGRRKKDFLIT